MSSRETLFLTKWIVKELFLKMLYFRIIFENLLQIDVRCQSVYELLFVCLTYICLIMSDSLSLFSVCLLLSLVFQGNFVINFKFSIVFASREYRRTMGERSKGKEEGGIMSKRRER